MFRTPMQLLLVAVVQLLVSAAANADDAYYQVPVAQLKLTEGKLPPATQPDWRQMQVVRLIKPYAAVHGSGEAFVTPADGAGWQAQAEQLVLSIRVPQRRDVTGKLFVPRGDASGMEVVRFEIPAHSSTIDARDAFYRAQLDHYEALLADGSAGAAWFRFRAAQAREALGDNAPAQQPENRTQRRTASEMADTYNLFTGGRAVSENLQLDRELPIAKEAQAGIDVKSIPGITVAEIDWNPLIKDLHPKLDPLAAYIPADQHAVFFPSIDAASSLIDASTSEGTPVLRMADPRSEDAMTRARYERQLGISLDDLAKLLGAVMVRSVAVTGSDPYLRTGSDIAVIFEPRDVAALRAALGARIEAARLAHGSAKGSKMQIEGAEVSVVRSDDRSMSSYLGAVGDAVVLSNSPKQIERIARAHRDGSALASLPEYTYFRARYPRGEESETAFIMLSDATIRRWCGPQWRIAASRRTRAAAIMSELQARYLDQLARGAVQPGVIHTERSHPDLGELRLTRDGVVSSVYASLEFLTPISELNFDKVTDDERSAYDRWRNNYQSNWRWAFDPIAARLGIHDARLEGDVTVMPLIWGTDYRTYVEISRGAKILPAATDPHNAIAHLAIAINRQSETVRGYLNFARNLAPGIGVDPLAWMGSTVSFYIDSAPYWDRPHGTDGVGPEEFVDVPYMLMIQSKDPVKLAAFLAALRAFVDQTAPGLTNWESLKHGEQPYVKVSASAKAQAEGPGLPLFAVYYASTATALIVSTSEVSLKRALDRRDPAAAATRPAPATQPWLGENLCAQIDRRLIDKVMPVFGSDANGAVANQLRARSWSNLPILNEWKGMYPDQDPVKLHERLWKTKLVCPGGGEYVWNERWYTMESTVFGHPGEPKMPNSPPKLLEGFSFFNFGLTFEEQGLRGRVSLDRDRLR